MIRALLKNTLCLDTTRLCDVALVIPNAVMSRRLQKVGSVRLFGKAFFSHISPFEHSSASRKPSQIVNP
jgi:hypothetical protein